jgi:hypothetical protein
MPARHRRQRLEPLSCLINTARVRQVHFNNRRREIPDLDGGVSAGIDTLANLIRTCKYAAITRKKYTSLQTTTI